MIISAILLGHVFINRHDDDDDDDDVYLLSPVDELSNAEEAITRTTWREFDCRDKADGSYGGGCRAFYRCLSGDTYLVQCKNQNVYDKNSQRCTQ